MERKDRASYSLKTQSVWGYPPSRFFQFLKQIEEKGLPKTLAVLGCSDGRYVIPAAKRKFEVLAVDIDETALFGEVSNNISGKVKIGGLVDRIQQEDVVDQVTVVSQDFLTYNPTIAFSGVFTSGSIHYVENTKYTLAYIVDKIKGYVSNNGILLLEYIVPSISDNDPNKHFVSSAEMAKHFCSPEWKIISNKRKTYIEESNPRTQHVHSISWGRLYATKVSLNS